MAYHRRRHGRSGDSYGIERARRHIQQARAFSDEVAGADEMVKAAFFNLSGRALERLLKEYEERNGELACEYARETIPKWRSGSVRMSGMVAERLFSLLPPYMRAEQKNRIVESIWKRHGPHSRKYVYVGPDSDPQAIVSDLETYFDNLNVLYPIPETLRRRFDWLSGNDVVAKEHLLNHFMDQQRSAAIASSQLNIPMILASMQADAQGTISKLSHTVFVGNHHVEIKADPRRRGYAFSDSPNDFVKPPVSFATLAGWAVAAAVVVGFLRLSGVWH